MVVRLKDLQSDEQQPKKLVRLSDLSNQQEEPEQPELAAPEYYNYDEPAGPPDMTARGISRRLPVIGSVLKGLDWVASNPISKAIAEYTVPDAPDIDPNAPAFSGATLPETNARRDFLESTGQEPATGVSKFVGQAAAPFFVPGAQLGTGTALSNTAGGILSKYAPRLEGVGLGAAREGLAGVPIGFASEYAQGEGGLGQAAVSGAAGGALGGVLGGSAPAAAKGLSKLAEKYSGSKIGDVLAKYFPIADNPSPQVEGQASEPLALPPASRESRLAAARERSNLAPGTEPVTPTIDVPANALPEGNYTRPTRLKVDSNPDNVLDHVMERIRPEVESIITPPQRRDLLIEYIQKHTDIPKEEIWNLPMQDLNELGQHVRNGIDLPKIATETAAKHGYDLPKLLDREVPSVSSKVAQDAQSRTYGVYPETLPTVKRPDSFNISGGARAAAPVESVGFTRPRGNATPKAGRVQEPPQLTGRNQTAPIIPRAEVRNVANKPKPNELGFAQTVRQSDSTSPTIKQRLEDAPMIGNRTTNAADEERARKLIERNGIHGATNDLLAKKKISSVDNFVAQELLKHYQEVGDIDSFLSVLNKTARENRFMGQAIQALSKWGKLDSEGAALLANKIVNRGKSAAESVDLTPEQLKPVTAATTKVGTANNTRNLADEVMKIVSNKANGEALTQEEQAVIQQFKNQVNEVNSAAKSFLPKAKNVDDTIKRVSEIKPKDRTRDQVTNYLDAKAEKARKRLAAQRNLGFAATSKGNPAVDYAIIGAAKIAKGVVKMADFTESMIKEYGSGIKPIINEVYNRSVNIFRRENGLPTIEELDRVVNAAIKRSSLTADEAYKMKSWANEIGFMSDKFKVEATQDMQLALRRLNPPTLGQKVSSLQASAQLLSIPTLLRNVLGNELFNVQEKFNKLLAVPIDYALSKLTGERHLVFKTNNQEQYWRNYGNGTAGGWKGVSPNGQLSASDIYPEAFGEKNPLKYLVKLTGAELQGFDHASYMRAYGDTVGTYATLLGKSKGLSNAEIKRQMPELIKQLDSKIMDIADQAGQYATFQDDTLLSKGAVGLKRLLNKPTDLANKYLVDKGVLNNKLSMEGFGLGDIILKYAKTPANIVMRGIDYSPLGFIRGIGELIPLVTKKEFNQREAALALSRAITGTLGLSGVGYALADAGILTGGSSSDADIRGLEGMSGKGAYKANLSALRRYIMSGLDKSEAQYQEGDKLMNYAWLQPAALSLAMGVDANKAINDKKLGVDKSSFEVALNALSGGLKSVLEQPLVTGVKQVAGIRSWDDVGKIFKGVPSSFVPALAGQARDFTDNATRSTYDPDMLKEVLNMVVNRLPGLSKSLPQTYSTLGTPNERIQGGKALTPPQFANSFLNPARFTAYTVTPEAKMVIDLINQTGETKVAPRATGKTLIVEDSVTKKNKSIDLTNEQYTELQRVVGEKTAAGLHRIQSILKDPARKDDVKVKRVVDLLDKVGNDARNDLRKRLGYKTK